MSAQKKDKCGNGWEVSIARTFDEVEAIRPIWEKMHNSEDYPVPNADIDRYLAVLRPQKDQMQPYVMLFRREGEPVAMVIGRLEKHRLTCRIGYKVLFKPMIRSLTVVYGGIMGKLDDLTCTELIREMLSILRRGEADMIFINHIKTDSPFLKFARNVPNFVCCGHFPIIQKHWTMSVPENIDEFYKRCSKKHRANLKRSIRKLEQEYPDKVEVVASSEKTEIDTAIRDIFEISRNTYQHALGKGAEDDSRTQSMMRTTAECGWLRAHLLYINNKPCAFQTALQYNQTYFLDQIGFDPEYMQHSIGTVLFLKVLEGLCIDPTVSTLDFGFGDAGYKRWYGDNSWHEALLYIFAPRLYPILINMLQSGATGLFLGANWLADRMGFMRYFKRRWRDYLQRTQHKKNQKKNGNKG